MSCICLIITHLTFRYDHSWISKKIVYFHFVYDCYQDSRGYKPNVYQNNLQVLFASYSSRITVCQEIPTKLWAYFLGSTFNLIDGLVQERSNSIANTMELNLSCTNPLLYCLTPFRMHNGGLPQGAYLSPTVMSIVPDMANRGPWMWMG